MVSRHDSENQQYAITTSCLNQERIKLTERIPHTGLIPVVIPLKIFLDLYVDSFSELYPLLLKLI